MEAEVICISSDDESPSKEKKRNQPAPITSTATCKIQEKIEILSSDDEKGDRKKFKRKISQVDEEKATNNNMQKKSKLNSDHQDPCKVENNKLESDSNSIPADIQQPNNHQEVTVKDLKLIVKEKKKISYVKHDTFPLFISLCLQNCQNDKDNEDMKKIITKLKRRYENMDTIYANSESFTSFLNDKRASIMANNKKKYVYIEEVMNEMKSKKKSQSPQQNSERYDAVPSTSYASDRRVNNDAENAQPLEEDDETPESPHTRKKIKQVEHAMVKCEKMIKKLEEAEVNFDEENDSNYIKVEKYKQRMVELYNKLCEFTGENTDAGRAYLRPKHFSTTRIVVVDQAITNFINAKITLRNQMKKVGTLTNDLIFPDYHDILGCIIRCNDRKNLGLTDERRKLMAKKAFEELGEYLQRARHNDYWDTFSLFLENKDEDPAIKDGELARKLADNRAEGDRRMAAVLEKYTQKQLQMKEQNGTPSEEEEEEEEEEKEESIIDDEHKNEDCLSIPSASDDEEDVNNTFKEKEATDESKKVTSIVTNDRDSDQNINRVPIAMPITPRRKRNHEVPIGTPAKNSETAVIEKNSNRKVNECADDAAISTLNTCTKKENGNISSLSSSCAADSASNINKVEEDLNQVIMEEITDSVIHTVKKQTPAKTNHVADSKTETVMQTKTQSSAEVMSQNKIADVTTVDRENEQVTFEDIMEVMEIDVADTTRENVASEKRQLEEVAEEETKKPRLRVCSFAKPPTTWQDNRQKTDKSASKSSAQAKVTSPTKNIIDLTNEVTISTTTTTTTMSISTTIATTTVTTANKTKSLAPVLTKYGLQIGNRVVPVVKRQTILVPPVKSIISVQNITNNYLKVDKRTGQILHNSREPVVIRLPTIQTVANRQNQSQNANAVSTRTEVPLKPKETVVRLIPTKKQPIVVSKKPMQAACDKGGMSQTVAKHK